MSFLQPSRRGKSRRPMTLGLAVAMSWAQRLKRVFGIDIEVCARCGGKLKVIASITVPEQVQAELRLGARAPPVQAGLL